MKTKAGHNRRHNPGRATSPFDSNATKIKYRDLTERESDGEGEKECDNTYKISDFRSVCFFYLYIYNVCESGASRMVTLIECRR